MGAVQSLCDRAILLNQGTLAFDGAPEDCVSRYFNLNRPEPKAGEAVVGTHPAVDPSTRQALLDHNVIAGAKSRHGDKALEIVAAAVVDSQGASTWDFEMMHRATVRILLRANAAVGRPSVGIQLHDRMGNLVFAAGTPQLQFALPEFKKGEEVVLDFRLTLAVYSGLYTLSLDAAEYDSSDPNLGNFHDRIGGLGPITVSRHQGGVYPFYGIAQLPMEIAYA
jgi:lipopolysaccharide transport system ATP-binding protein